MNAATLRAAVACSAGTLVAVILVGCAQIDDSTIGTASPWASEFQDEYNKATDPFVRAVLADGKITDQEEAEMWERFSSCLKEGGVTLGEVKESGAYNYSFEESVGPDKAHEIASACSDKSGEYPIGALYSWVARNPQNLDEATIMVQCLIDKGAVAESYSTDDFTRDSSTQSYPYLDKDLGPALLTECSDDPLGLLK